MAHPDDEFCKKCGAVASAPVHTGESEARPATYHLFVQRRGEIELWPGGAQIDNVPGEWDERTQGLFAWWMRNAADDFLKTTPKMREYGGGSQGSADLEVMGDALRELLGNTEGPVAQELAVWLYALGKISRLISDYKAGRRGKADTWFDLTVYAMMARRIQEKGQWP